MRLLQRLALKFNEAGVPVMALKGAALNLIIYDQPDARLMADLDLLVRHQDLELATAVLEEMGCLRSQVLVREDFFPQFYYEIEYTAGGINPVVIDLHVRPFRPLRYSRFVPDDAFWERAEPVKMGKATVLVPSGDDLLIHLAAHCSIHGNSREKWLYDIKKWVECRGSKINWERFLATAKAWRLALPVRDGMRAAQKQHGQILPSGVTQRLDAERTNWRDRLALWQAPRDNDHPVLHVLVNALSTPGWRFVISYLLAVGVPGRKHMGEWYSRRHWAWLPCSHLVRVLWPIIGRTRRVWSWFLKFEIRDSPIHGKGVFASRDISTGEVIGRYRVKPVQRHSPYVVLSQTVSPGRSQGYAITGPLRFLNHACQANAELSGRKLVAIRDIRIDQEITMDYMEGACECHQHAIQNENEDAGQDTTQQELHMNSLARGSQYLTPARQGARDEDS